MNKHITHGTQLSSCMKAYMCLPFLCLKGFEIKLSSLTIQLTEGVPIDLKHTLYFLRTLLKFYSSSFVYLINERQVRILEMIYQHAVLNFIRQFTAFFSFPPPPKKTCSHYLEHSGT